MTPVQEEGGRILRTTPVEWKGTGPRLRDPSLYRPKLCTCINREKGGLNKPGLACVPNCRVCTK